MAAEECFRHVSDGFDDAHDAAKYELLNVKVEVIETSFSSNENFNFRYAAHIIVHVSR